MYTGMIFTAFISWIISFFALLTFFNLFTKSKGERIILAFAGFWLMTGILWFLAGLRLWFAWLGHFDIDQTLFTIGQIFLFASMVVVPYFATRQWFSKGKINVVIISTFILLAFIAVFFILKEGVIVGEVTYFTSEYSLYKFPRALFVFMFALLWFSILLSSMKEIIKRLKRIPISQSFLLPNISIFLYGSVGFFDELTFFTGWPVVFLRLIIIIATILAYLSFEKKQNA